MEQTDLLPDYLTAWDAWLADMQNAGKMQRDTSSTVYAHMWTSLARWGVTQGVPLTKLTPQRLDDYLASRAGDADLSPRYAWRLLRLVERIQAHHGRSEARQINTAATDLLARRPEIRYANAQDADPLPECLSLGEASRLVSHLSSVRPRLAHADIAPGHAGAQWQDIRNRAAVAVQLGGGLTPGELRALSVSQLTLVTTAHKTHAVVEKLHVPGDGRTPDRDTPLAAWAGQLLGYWLAVRSALGIPGEWVFPSTRSTGKPWGKVAQYDNAKKVLAQAGIDGGSGGSYPLRHTFALRQLRRGTPPAVVAQWLGVTDQGVMDRYQRVLSAQVEVV